MMELEQRQMAALGRLPPWVSTVAGRAIPKRATAPRAAVWWRDRAGIVGSVQSPTSRRSA